MIGDRELKLLNRIRQIGVVKRGSFILSSGLTSSYYIDGRLASLDGLAVTLIGHIVAKRLPKSVRSIGGPAVGAVPLVTSVIMAANSQKRLLKGFYVRSNSKQHGRRQLIEGELESPVVIIDDTCTTGSSVLNVAAILRAKGIVITRIIAVFDRGGGSKVTEAGYSYSALFKIRAGQIEIYK